MVDEKWLNEETAKYVCPECDKEYSKKGISTHILRSHKKDLRFQNVGTLAKTWTLSADYISPKTLRKQEELSNRKINKCEKCFVTPSVWFGSGRFCSIKCANSRTKSKETKSKISKSLTKFSKVSFCKYCLKCYEGKNMFCSTSCKSEYKRKDYSDIKKYRIASSFKFKLSDYPEKYDFYLIKKYGWYKAKNRGDNQNGVSRDHIISVRYGFDNNIPSWIIRHPANCELMRHKDNVSKNKKCNMTLDELLYKIDNW